MPKMGSHDALAGSVAAQRREQGRQALRPLEFENVSGSHARRTPPMHASPAGQASMVDALKSPRV